MNRLRWWLLGGTVAVAGAIAAAVIVGTRGVSYADPPAGAPRSVVANGQTFHYVALLHWGNAVAVNDRHIQIQVYHGFLRERNACAADAVRLVVTEDAHRVEIAAAGYGTKHRHPIPCPTDLIVDKPIVSLAHPLAGRQLVDASDHQVRVVGLSDGRSVIRLPA